MEHCYSTKLFFLITFLPLSLSCECTISSTTSHNREVVALKLLAIASILVAGACGILIPILGRKIALLRPESNVFFVIKAFAAGVILATALVHILPNVFDRLTSPCIGRKPWHQFPIAGFVAMGSALVTMTTDSFVTRYYRRSQINSKALPVDDDEVVEVETAHGTHGHAPGLASAKAARDSVKESMAERIRHRVISQVLELGIVVHSVIIGVSLGTSKRSSTIRPLLGALSLHQFFEGIGLGGCIIQAKFKARATMIMAIFFSLTTPSGIGLGIAISSCYNENSSTALSVEGIFDAASSGILIYMALVDLLAADFMTERMQSSLRLQLGAHIALLLGAGFMSILAIWA